MGGLYMVIDLCAGCRWKYVIYFRETIIHFRGIQILPKITRWTCPVCSTQL